MLLSALRQARNVGRHAIKTTIVKVSFEEKTYENYFNAELDRVSSIFFPLGQVQEGNLGFDSSAFSSSRRLWRRLGFPFWFFPPFDGVSLRAIADEMERFLGIAINDMPSMKANILFQYKKPEFITMSSGSEWTHWNEPYFRYNVYKEQHDLLTQIETRFSSKILVLYASPAAQDINELVTLKIGRQIIVNSNFTKSSDLDGHHRNTYIKAGTHSIACSKPKKLDNLDLLNELETIGNNNETNNSENNRQFLINFRKQIVGLVYENGYYGESFRKLNSEIGQIESYEIFQSFVVMSNFRFLTGVQWLVKL
jgi:hypothetical protein